MLVFLTLCAARHSAGQSGTPTVTDPLGQYAHTLAPLGDPNGVAFLPDGSLIVVQAVPPAIHRYDAAGTRVHTFGNRGRGAGELLRPAGVCVSEDNLLFVADAANDRIQSYSLAGEPLAAYGDGQLSGPGGVATDAERVVVADTLNHRVVAFRRVNGDLLWSTGKFGRDAGEFALPADVALDTDGAAYVVDSENSRIQKLDRAGRHQKTWGLWGYHPGLLAGPLGIAVRGDRVYVADAMNHRIQVYTTDGELLYMWGRHVLLPHEGDGKLHYPARVAVSADGRRAAVCETFENRVQMFDLRPDGRPEPPVAGTTADLGPAAHYGPYITASGNRLTLTEPESHALLVFDTSRKDAIQISRVSGRGSKFGEFLSPLAVGADPMSGTVFAVDRGNRRLQMFRYQPEDGDVRILPNLARFVRAIDYSVLAGAVKDAPALEDISPTAIRCDAQGRLFILDARYERMIVLSREYQRVAAWSTRADASSPHGATDFVLDDARGRVAIVDGLAACVNVFDTNGRFLFRFGGLGDSPGRFISPFGIACNTTGDYFVTDGGAHRVSRFDTAGNFELAWGEPGLGAGQFYKPRGAVIDPRGRLYVVDWGNHRVQWFSQNGEYQGIFGARAYTRPARLPATTQESRP